MHITKEAQILIDAALGQSDISVPAFWKGVGISYENDCSDDGLVLYICRPGYEHTPDRSRPLKVAGLLIDETDSFLIGTLKEVGERIAAKIDENQRKIQRLQAENKELQARKKEVCKKLGILK